MIPNLAFTSKYFYIFNQVKSKSTYLLSNLSAINLYTKSFCHLVNILTFTITKLIFAYKISFSYSFKLVFYPYYYQRYL